jgi:hypothetical protein
MPSLKTKALNTLQKLARVAAADDNGYVRCVSCGTATHWKEADGGHYIAKGHSSYWSLRIENVHPQCKGCNTYGMRFGTAANEYTKWMIDYYGREFVDDMEKLKRTPVKIYKKEYEELIAEWNGLIKQHLERIGDQ